MKKLRAAVYALVAVSFHALVAVSFHALVAASFHVMNVIEGFGSNKVYNMESVPAFGWKIIQIKATSSVAVCAALCTRKCFCNAFKISGQFCFLGTYNQYDEVENDGKNMTIWKGNTKKEDKVIFIVDREATEILDLDGCCSGLGSNIPKGRLQSSKHFFEDKLLICGGDIEQNSCISSTNPSQGIWLYHSNLLNKRRAHGGGVLNSTVFLVGGSSRSTDQLKEGSTTWMEGPRPKHTDGICIATNEETQSLYVTQYRSSVFRIDRTTNRWITLPNAPIILYHHACSMAKIGGKEKLIVAGNKDGNASYMLDVDSKVWTKIGSLNIERNGNGKMVNFNGRILMIGGINNGTFTNTVEELNLMDLTWSILKFTINIEKQSQYVSATVIPKKMVLDMCK